MPDDYRNAMEETDNVPEPDDLDRQLHYVLHLHTWEKGLQAMAGRAHDQAQHIRTQDQEGNDWTEAEYLDHVAEKLGSLARYCGYRSM